MEIGVFELLRITRGPGKMAVRIYHRNLFDLSEKPVQQLLVFVRILAPGEANGQQRQNHGAEFHLILHPSHGCFQTLSTLERNHFPVRRNSSYRRLYSAL